MDPPGIRNGPKEYGKPEDTSILNPIARLARASLLSNVTTGKLPFRYAFVEVIGSVSSTSVRVVGVAPSFEIVSPLDSL